MSKEIRKYFESAEEMHKAFLEGKKVYWKDYDDSLKPRYYQIKDGIICSFDVSNDKMLGVAVGSFSECTNYFTFEKPVLKMKVGKKYKTRDNQIVFCFNTFTRSRKKKYDIVTLNRSTSAADWWYTVNEDGTYWNGGKLESACDIVEEVEVKL